MKIAVIGLGVIGKVHVERIINTSEELVGICDIDTEKLALYPDVKGYVDYVQMLDECQPDVVHICTPHYLHTEMIIAALKKNINVLCEKPLCIKEEEIPLILEAEQNSKAQLGVCFQNRYNQTTLIAKELLKGQKITSANGVLMWKRGADYYNQAEWRGKKTKEGGGVLINQALHTIDLIQWFVGMPESLTAWCKNFSLQGIIDVEDTATIVSNGDVDVSLFATNAAIFDCPAEITIRTQELEICLSTDAVYCNGKKQEFENKKVGNAKQVYGNGHHSLINDFYDCVKTGKKFSVDGAEAAKAMRIVFAAYKSFGNKIMV